MTAVNFAELLQQAGPVGEPVPDGSYDVACVQSEAKTASTGRPMIVARFKVLTGPHANRVIVNNFVLTVENPTALGFFFRHMAVFGMGNDYFAANPPLEQVAAQILNRQARVTLQTNNGRQNANAWEAIPGGTLSAAPAPAATPGPAAAYPAPAPAPAAAPAPAPAAPSPGYAAPAPGPVGAPGYPGVAPVAPVAPAAAAPVPAPAPAPAPQPAAPVSYEQYVAPPQPAPAVPADGSVLSGTAPAPAPAPAPQGEIPI